MDYCNLFLSIHTNQSIFQKNMDYMDMDTQFYLVHNTHKNMFIHKEYCFKKLWGKSTKILGIISLLSWIIPENSITGDVFINRTTREESPWKLKPSLIDCGVHLVTGHLRIGMEFRKVPPPFWWRLIRFRSGNHFWTCLERWNDPESQMAICRICCPEMLLY